MKKVFLSVPMRGRTKENIEASLKKMKEYVKIALGEDVEFINTIVKETPPEDGNSSVWYLGKSIQLLSQADVLVSVDTPHFIRARGCEHEEAIFTDYIMNYNERYTSYIKIPFALAFSEEEIEELERQYYSSPLASETKGTVTRG